MTTKSMTLKLAGIALALCFAAGSAQATVLSSFLTFDGPQHTPGGIPFQGGGEDKLQDDSLSAFEDRDQSQGFSNGDVVWGVLTLSEISASGQPSLAVGANSQIAIVFSARIDGAGSGGSINLSPIANAADPRDLRNLLAASVQGGFDDNTVAAILSTTTSSANPADDPLNWDTAQVSTDFTNANNWFWEATVGLVGLDDFFEFLGSLALGGTERGAFTVQSQAFFVEDWLPVDVLDFAVATHLGDVTFDVGTVNIANADEQSRGWTFRDQSSFFVNPIPEPSSIALLGLALAGLGFGLRRRTA